MAHFNVCNCDEPESGPTGQTCKKCNGFIDNIEEKTAEVWNKKINKPKKEKDTYEWFEEDPENVKIYASIAEMVDKVERGAELYTKSFVFNQCINQIAHGVDPIQVIKDLSMKFDSFRKEMEDYMSKDNRPFLRDPKT